MEVIESKDGTCIDCVYFKKFECVAQTCWQGPHIFIYYEPSIGDTLVHTSGKEYQVTDSFPTKVGNKWVTGYVYEHEGNKFMRPYYGFKNFKRKENESVN